jgi:hypothetical protein
MIKERGGNASNVREAGHWADRTLADAAEAAAKGDRTAAKAIKIVKRPRGRSEQLSQKACPGIHEEQLAFCREP